MAVKKKVHFRYRPHAVMVAHTLLSIHCLLVNKCVRYMDIWILIVFLKVWDRKSTKENTWEKLGLKLKTVVMVNIYTLEFVKGAYPDNPNAYVCGDWIFSGYTACTSVKDDWYELKRTPRQGQFSALILKIP